MRDRRAERAVGRQLHPAAAAHALRARLLFTLDPDQHVAPPPDRAGRPSRGSNGRPLPVSVLRLVRQYAFTIVGIAIGVAGSWPSARWPSASCASSRAATASCSGRSRWPGAGWAWARASPPAACCRGQRRAIAAASQGVAGVQAQVMLPLNPTTSQFMTLTQELVLGMDLAVPMPNRHYRDAARRAGRFLRAGRPPGGRAWARPSRPRAASRVGPPAARGRVLRGGRACSSGRSPRPTAS